MHIVFIQGPILPGMKLGTNIRQLVFYIQRMKLYFIEGKCSCDCKSRSQNAFIFIEILIRFTTKRHWYFTFFSVNFYQKTVQKYIL